MKLVAPMAGITDSNFLIKLIPFGFNAVSLGGYNLDEATLNAATNVLSRGRKEFIIPLDNIYSHISSEVFKLKNFNNNMTVFANLRSSNPEDIVKISKIPDLDVVEINCHCRQEEFLAIGCGQEMLLRDDLLDFISYVVDNASSKVSVKIRANVSGVDTLNISKKIASTGINYLHIDAMKPGFNDFDFDLLNEIVKNVDVNIIGNNSINNSNQVSKILKTGVNGFSIGRAVINGSLDFEI
ncbi:tRNA-dihydrouridine synthase [Methanobrevibacter sp. DSM 116169]|uniref:tRNA-dihydrouridine synthase n=1 Tax=Methanobrevibacter sp. DSM 116169 TaxID=3242727 RepID=UPI0038FC0D04